ncbi:protein FAM114A2 [Coccinella septempunctata]|uniref:protein FAM114A2 n=1 Tax=Coccinella septempunctata TaxID=41139 RepID=UPI001D097227|nr:protein FAM114A2 [Coccinella septempunctata]
MDTSDSEYFESADEDMQSDGEERNILKSEDVHGNYEIDDRNPMLTNSCMERTQNEEGKIDQSQDINYSKNSNEPSLISKFNNIQLKCEDPSSHAEKNAEIEDSCKESKDSNLAVDEKIDNTDTTLKKSQSNITSELGCETTKKLEKCEVPPKKVTENIEEVEPVLEKKNLPDHGDAQINEEENLWEDDELDWGAEAIIENKTSVEQVSSSNYENKKICDEKQNIESDSWSSWSNWGVSVLSTATQSVSSITSQITNVIETGLGAVDPEELARIEQAEMKKSKQKSFVQEGEKLENTDSIEGSYGSFGLGNLVKMVENTGTKVISGGLDTLETIGKKTMEVLQEGDPGLKKKRAFLNIDQEKPVLSQILREAKERAENESRTLEEHSMKKCKNYETLFDDHHGLVHLEALELLSKQCEIKLKNIQSSMTGDEFTDFCETMDQIKELCELPDEEDEEQMSLDEIKKRLEKAVSEMNIQITYEKLVANWEEMEVWLTTLDLDICDEKEVHQQAIETLAEMTSRAMEQFHKTGELLLIKERRSTADEADSLVQITATLISLIGIVAAKFSEKLNSKVANDRTVSGLITNVFFEAANSSSYIQDALQLLIPVLQVGAI